MSDQIAGWNVPAQAEAAAPSQKFDILYPGQPETEDPEHFRLRRNAEVQQWLNNKEIAGQAVDLERDSRAKVTATLFPTPKKGTQRYDIGGGYTVKLIHGLTYTLGNKEAVDENQKSIAIETQVRALEDKIVAEHGDAGEQVLKRLIKWKPELSGSEYEKLDEANPIELACRNAIDEMLTIKPNTPQLAFEEPKVK